VGKLRLMQQGNINVIFRQWNSCRATVEEGVSLIQLLKFNVHSLWCLGLF